MQTDREVSHRPHKPFLDMRSCTQCSWETSPVTAKYCQRVYCSNSKFTCSQVIKPSPVQIPGFVLDPPRLSRRMQLVPEPLCGLETARYPRMHLASTTSKHQPANGRGENPWNIKILLLLCHEM